MVIHGGTMRTLITLLTSMLVGSLALGQGKQIEITWLGHAAFEIVSPGGTRILLDPFIKQNPKTPDQFKELSRYRPSAILVTHSHFDHAADAAEIAKQSGAPVISTFDYVSTLAIPDEQKKGGNVGGSFVIGDVTVSLVPAMHSSEGGGRPLGFVLKFVDGRTLYHTGDTWIFGDMELIGELYQPSIILLNVGGGPFTQDPKTAAMAVKKYFKPGVIIPMHYGTFPVLSTQQDVEAAFSGDKRVVMMNPGETKKF
jgi:L-ascorbate metabolism protein UlaG (beta-lactamase superfamily)